MPQTGTKTEAILEIDRLHGSGLWQPELALVRGEGVRVWDAEGKEYLDCLAGIAVASVGHANPRLVRALSEQAGKLIAFAQNIGNDTRSAFLEKLFRFVPKPYSRAFMANSGSEVNEAAIKWARVATGRSRFVAAKRGFSGRTLGVLGLTWEPKYREPFGPLPLPVDHVPYNNIEALDQAIGDDTAAVFIEPVQGEGGIHPASGEYLEAARRLSRERGALLVFDEIQSGVGRSGKFLASELYGVEGDMATLAKGLGGGVPIGALLMTEEVAGKMPAGGHGTTFGGNPLASAAGLAVLEEIETRGLLEQVSRTGEYFRQRLEAIGSPKVREVRGLGLLIGMELKEKAAPYVSKLREAGVLTINAGSTVIRFVPPLIIEEPEVDEVVERVAQVLSEG
ncbi:MAG TPA: acetylornithine/succinylornithine family transaminase [Trueperaceae bacterium]